MKKAFTALILLTVANFYPLIAEAQENTGQSTVQNEDRAVPYKEVDLENDDLKKIWIDPEGTDSWWHLKDDGRSTYIASFKNDIGQNVQISQWIDHYACSPTKCPVRVIVDGKKIFDDTICADRSEHTLTMNRNAVFLCDFVITLRSDDKEAAK